MSKKQKQWKKQIQKKKNRLTKKHKYKNTNTKIQIQNRKFPKRRGQRGNTKQVARVANGDCENVNTCWSSKFTKTNQQ